MLSINGQKDIRKIMSDPAESRIISCCRVSSCFVHNTENTILIIIWETKKRKTLKPYGFQLSASSNLKRSKSEKLCESPHEKHGSPVIFSWMQATG